MIKQPVKALNSAIATFGRAIAERAVAALNARTKYDQVQHASFPLQQGLLGTAGSEDSDPNGDDTTVFSEVMWKRKPVSVPNAGGSPTYTDLGATASFGHAHGFVSMKRGARVGRGTWSVWDKGSGNAGIQWTVNGDNCGLTASGNISGGVLRLGLQADAAGSATSVILTYFLEEAL